MSIFKVERHSIGSSENSIGTGLTAVPVSNKDMQSGSIVHTQSESGILSAPNKKCKTQSESYTHTQERISQVKADSHYKKRKRQVATAIVPGKGIVHISLSKTDMTVLNQMKNKNAKIE